MLAARNLGSADLSALRMCPAGGAPFPVELMERWRHATGLEIYEGYGMSEMAPISAATAQSGVRPGSVGKPIPGSDVQVVDLETGLRVLPPGEKGELRVRGPHMMTGYRNRPEETAQTIRDGFIYTGDIGHVDEDGFVFITDRKKDVVFVTGFNVFPREVEELIHTHRSVGVAGVVGVPDARTGGERLQLQMPERGAGGRATAHYGRSQAGSRRTASSRPRRAGARDRLKPGEAVITAVRAAIRPRMAAERPATERARRSTRPRSRGTARPGWSARRFILLRHRCDRSVELGNRFIQTVKLMNEFRQRLAHFKRDCLVTGLDQLGQFASVSGPLRRDDAHLGQVTAQSIEQLCALRNQHLPYLVTHQRRLVLKRAHADKSHRGPRNRLANRRRVRRVVLLPPHIGLHINGRHHARVMAELDQLARPMMRRSTGLEPYQARR